MNKRNQKTLLSAKAIIEKLNGSESQWLTETAESLGNIAQSLDAIERLSKQVNRRPRAGVPPIIRKTSSCPKCGCREGDLHKQDCEVFQDAINRPWPKEKRE